MEPKDSCTYTFYIIAIVVIAIVIYYIIKPKHVIKAESFTIKNDYLVPEDNEIKYLDSLTIDQANQIANQIAGAIDPETQDAIMNHKWGEHVRDQALSNSAYHFPAGEIHDVA